MLWSRVQLPQMDVVGVAMDKVRRILVYVCKERAAPRRAQFVQVGADVVSHHL